MYNRLQHKAARPRRRELEDARHEWVEVTETAAGSSRRTCRQRKLELAVFSRAVGQYGETRVTPKVCFYKSLDAACPNLPPLFPHFLLSARSKKKISPNSTFAIYQILSLTI